MRAFSGRICIRKESAIQFEVGIEQRDAEGIAYLLGCTLHVAQVRGHSRHLRETVKRSFYNFQDCCKAYKLSSKTRCKMLQSTLIECRI